VHANRANGLARPPSNGIGPLVDHNELALLSEWEQPTGDIALWRSTRVAVGI
jgi:hypothetical protein